MTEKTYTPEEVKKLLQQSMNKFTRQMIGIIRECAAVRPYRDMNGKEALTRVADKLQKLEEIYNETPAK